MPQAARPTIGDFRTTPNNPPREEKKAAQPAPEPTDQTVPVPDTAPDATDPEAERTSGELYMERLKAAKIDIKEAMGIFDAVMTKGFYEEYVHVRNQRATFRTRMYEDHLRLQTELELRKPQLVISQDELITRFNLASSLYEWQGQTFKHESEDDFDAVMKFLRKLPGPLYTLLARELSKFDSKIMLVFSEGATENF